MREATTPAFATILRADPARPANKLVELLDGKPVKRSYGNVANYTAQVARADDPAALAALLKEVASDPAALVSLGYVPDLAPTGDDALGPRFRIITRAKAGRCLGLPATASPGEIDAASNGQPFDFMGLPTVTRTKGFWRFGGWVLFDRDPAADMPDDIRRAVAEDDAWLAAMERVAPGFATAGRVRLRSSTGRVRWRGEPLPAAGVHEYIRLDRPDLVGLLGEALMVNAALAGLTWRKPSRDGKTGETVATTVQPIWDTATFSAERLVFVGCPVVQGEGLTLDPPRVEVFEGDPLPVAAVPERDVEDLQAAARITGTAFSARRRLRDMTSASDGFHFSGPTTTKHNLALETYVETADFGGATLREICARPWEKLRCQVPDAFRVSTSWNGVLWRQRDGAPILFDNGARVRHVLSPAAREEWESEFLLPAVLPDAPPPPAMMDMETAGQAVREELDGWLQASFALVERRIKRKVWQASWMERAVKVKALPPADFLPRPDAIQASFMAEPLGRLELLKVSTGIGKTRRAAEAAVAAVAAAPMVLGLQRRVFIVAKDHAVADELAADCSRIAATTGSTVTVSRYRGIAADDPAQPGTPMCPLFQARMAAQAAGLSSARLCSVRADDAGDDDNTDGRRTYCAHHPDNPRRNGPACGWQQQDLHGAIVIFAGWNALTRGLSNRALTRHVTLTGTNGDGKPVEVDVPVDPCDALILDESDPGQLVAGAATVASAASEGDGDEDGEAAPGTIALGSLPTMVWPGMFSEPDANWRELVPEDRQDEAETCAKLLGFLRERLLRLPDGASLSPASMASAGTAQQWADASRFAWTAKETAQHALRPNMTTRAVKKEVAAIHAHNRRVGSTARLLRLVAEMVEHCSDDSETELVRVKDGKALMRSALPLKHWCAALPTLLLDATADLSLLATWWPDAVVRAEIIGAWAATGVQHVVVQDVSGSYAQLTGDGTLDRAAAKTADLADALGWLFDGKVMMGGPRDLMQAARDLARDRTKTAAAWVHFGAGRGLNVAADARVEIVQGRPLPPSAAVEVDAALLRHGKPVAAEARGYDKVPAFHRMANGEARQGWRYGHKDPLADALLRQRTLAELEQLEQRGRLRRRDASRPLLVISVSNLAMEDRRRVDRMTSKRTAMALHPEVRAASLDLVVRREDRGALAVLARVLDAQGYSEDPKAAAERLLDRLRGWRPAGLWEAASAGSGAPCTPEDLARWDAAAEGWAAAARRKIAAEGAAGCWWRCWVRLAGSDLRVAAAVRATDAQAAQARALELLGQDAMVEMAPAARVTPPPAEAADSPPSVARIMEQAAAGGGVRERAAALLASGVVPLHRDHAARLFPGLFASAKAAERAVKLATSGLEIRHKAPAKPENPFIYILRAFPVSEPLCGVSPPPWALWRFRAEGATRPGHAWVQAGREAEAKTKLEAVLGPLALWRLAEGKRAKQPVAEAQEAPPAPAEPPPEAAPPPPAAVVDDDLPPDLRPPLDGVTSLFIPFFPVAAPPPVAPAPPMAAPWTAPPEAMERLLALSRRLEAVRPPNLWQDGFDTLRIARWRERCAAAAATFPPDPLPLEVLTRAT